MPKFRSKPVIVEAARWFENGDHPADYVSPREGTNKANQPVTVTAQYAQDHKWEGEVVRRFRHPTVAGSQLCEQCQEPMDIHGYLEPSKVRPGMPVCPGDWVITDPDGAGYTPMRPDLFAEHFEGPVTEDGEDEIECTCDTSACAKHG